MEQLELLITDMFVLVRRLLNCSLKSVQLPAMKFFQPKDDL